MLPDEHAAATRPSSEATSSQMLRLIALPRGRVMHVECRGVVVRYKVGMTTGPWWRRAVIYQVYVRSFADSDGDGMGDLAGVRSRLAYLRDLGVDAIWLNPFYPSPQADAGYDVSDYRGVDPMFGTLADFDALVEDAHRLGLHVIVDLVPNHTSDRHPWFRAALAAGPGSRERDRYVFRAGLGPDGDQPPNDWVSVFGGPAWQRVTDPGGAPGQWYLHLFAPEQPDLNWTNDEIKDEFDSILRFWLDRGVDGFRIDVAHGMAKHPDLPDIAGAYPGAGPAVAGHPYWDQDGVHEVYRRWRRIADAYPRDVTFVGEVWVQTPERLARYLRPDELHTAFNFDFLLAPWEAAAMRAAIDQSIAALAGVGAPTTWVLSNHDVVRHVTRYGGGDLGRRRARAAALLMLALPGGAYVYQGDELGLPQVTDLPDEVLQDPTFFRTGGVERGRDGARVPMPWSGDEPPFGFGPSGPAGGPQPWLPQPTRWADLTAERQLADPGSMLSLYRDALRLRRALHLGEQPLTWIDPGGATELLAFRRGDHFVCVVNFGDDPVAMPATTDAASLLLASGPLDADGKLPGATAGWWAI
jgi:alpha-glucosidase